MNLERPELINQRLRDFLSAGVDEIEANDALIGPDAGGPAPRERSAVAKPIGVGRRLSIGVMRAGRSNAPMHGLVEVDVTETLARREAIDPAPSITALVVATVARLAARHPEVHRYRDWRGRMVEHRHVDVNTLVEIPARGGRFPLATVVHDADIRTVGDITAQLDRTKNDASSQPDVGVLERAPSWLARLPGLIPGLYWLLSRTERGRARSGTVSVSAVGMFGAGGGFGIAPASLYSLNVIVGGLEDRARVVDGTITVRRMLDLTVSFDHNLIDGGPAARFMAELRQSLSRGDVLDAN
jgi:pyruvate/2-oxoglutarate dehydrogenase complex dihydrolipoamide acyltransferase (E2) component